MVAELYFSSHDVTHIPHIAATRWNRTTWFMRSVGHLYTVNRPGLPLLSACEKISTLGPADHCRVSIILDRGFTHRQQKELSEYCHNRIPEIQYTMWCVGLLFHPTLCVLERPHAVAPSQLSPYNYRLASQTHSIFFYTFLFSLMCTWEDFSVGQPSWNCSGSNTFNHRVLFSWASEKSYTLVVWVFYQSY
jgi:hypothetical protein